MVSESKKQYRAEMRRKHGDDWWRSQHPDDVETRFWSAWPRKIGRLSAEPGEHDHALSYVGHEDQPVGEPLVTIEYTLVLGRATHRPGWTVYLPDYTDEFTEGSAELGKYTTEASAIAAVTKHINANWPLVSWRRHLRNRRKLT